MVNKKMVKSVIGFLFVIALMLSGCATERKSVVSRKGAGKSSAISEDVLVFRDLQQIDLDGDGKKEILAVYTTSSNSSGVKVIKINEREKGIMIFEKKFGLPPETEFKVIKETPAITVKKTDPISKKTSKEIYVWAGKAFVPASGSSAT